MSWGEQSSDYTKFKLYDRVRTWDPCNVHYFSYEIKNSHVYSFNLDIHSTNLDSILKSRDITLPTKVCLVKALVFSSSHIWMWDLDYKESWMLKNWCFWTVVLKKTLESPLDFKEIQPVHPKGNQSWIFIRRTNAEVEAPILWPPDLKNWRVWKDPDTRKDWMWEKKGITDDEMVGWHHWLNGHEFEYALGVGDRQRCLACCSPWSHKELDTTEWLNWLTYSFNQ